MSKKFLFALITLLGTSQLVYASPLPPPAPDASPINGSWYILLAAALVYGTYVSVQKKTT